MNWYWPLPGCGRYSSYAGMFGAERKYDIHTGIDIYCDPEQACCTVESGKVTKIEIFTGPNAEPPSDWWHETWAVHVEGNSGVVVYGEIKPLSSIKIGDKLPMGKIIGHIQTVLKVDKGMPMTMLHLELYKRGTTETVIWQLGEPQPDNLLDPTFFLRK